MRACARSLRTLAAAAAALATGLAGCGPEHPFDCKDVDVTSAVSFLDVRALVVDPGPKSCARCHNATTPVYGYDFEGPAVAYDALTTHIGPIYEQLASGRMPKDGTRWTEDDLRVLRTWYCNGALYAE